MRNIATNVSGLVYRRPGHFRAVIFSRPIFGNMEEKFSLVIVPTKIGALQIHVIQIYCHGNVSGILRRHFDWSQVAL